MNRKVYVKSSCGLSFKEAAPDFGKFLTPMEARRMNPLMKKALVTSLTALKEAGIETPDAIISGTGYGCVANSEALLASLTGLTDSPMKPTHFMQSTHNTVGSMIAIRLKCHGYNATYSHRVFSFESALLDAFLQISSGQIDNALVGAFEEMTPEFAIMLSKLGFSPYAADGSLSETAVSMVLSSSREGALCEIQDVFISRRNVDSDSMPRIEKIERSSYAAEYGGNFSCSAYGALEAVARISGGNTGALAVSNECSEQGRSMITFVPLCGD